MDDSQPSQYTYMHLVLGITAGLALGIISTTVLAHSLRTQQKKKTILFAEDLRDNFVFLAHTAKTVFEDIPQLFKHLHTPLAKEQASPTVIDHNDL